LKENNGAEEKKQFINPPIDIIFTKIWTLVKDKSNPANPANTINAVHIIILFGLGILNPTGGIRAQNEITAATI
jgi:hypothetical protein